MALQPCAKRHILTDNFMPAPQLVSDQCDERIAWLLAEKQQLVAYAHMKLDSGDYHGCADACMDLREVDAKLSVLRV